MANVSVSQIPFQVTVAVASAEVIETPAEYPNVENVLSTQHRTPVEISTLR